MARIHERPPKSVLKLRDLEQSKSAVLNSLPSLSSQRSYDHAIRQFIDWYCSEPRLAFNRIVVTRFCIFLEQAHYASSTINLRLAAVRRLSYEAADSGLLGSDLAADIRRVKGAKKHGARVGNWLTVEQGKALLSTFDRTSLRGKRDYAMVAVLLGCGFRRAELAATQVQDVQQREDHCEQCSVPSTKPAPQGSTGSALRSSGASSSNLLQPAGWRTSRLTTFSALARAYVTWRRREPEQIQFLLAT